jgi:hypothetical protein
MKTKKVRDISVFSLSFLDVISCGFGAVILLFVISLGSERLVIVDIRDTLEKLFQERLAELEKVRTKRDEMFVMLTTEERVEREKTSKIKSMESDIEELINRIKEATSGQESLVVDVESLEEEIDAREKEVSIPQNESELPIGVPVLSNHLIFILDTSGSMRDPSTGRIWKYVTDKIKETLEVYPIVTGIQIMDADGNFVLRGSRTSWLPDSQSTRNNITKAILFYEHHSQSNPVPGILKAIRTFRDTENEEKKIGIYIFGDEFTQTAEKVLNRINQANKPDEEGVRPITINAMGFPHVIKYERHFTRTGLKFANLMRELTYQHGGAFIGTL